MKTKHLAIAVACLAVLSGLVYLINRPPAPPPPDPRIGQPLLSADIPANAAKFRFSDQGKLIALTRQPDDSWQVDSYHNLPADFDKLSRFIADFTDTKIDRFVTANPDRLARLDLDTTRVDLWDKSGKTIWSLSLGKTSDSGGRFVRFDDENKAYLASLNAWFDTEPKNWADAQLMNVKSDDVAKMEIPLDDGTVTVTRKKTDAEWTTENAPAGQRVSDQKMTTVLASLCNLRFSDTNDVNNPDALGARDHQREFKLTLFNGQTYTVALGRRPPQRKLVTLPPQLLAAKAAAAKPGAAAKPPRPLYTTLPAGPVFVFVTSPEPRAAVNTMMTERSFKVEDYILTGLPGKRSDIFEPIPPAPAQAAPSKGS
jgi:hypothetical protein